MMSAAFMIAAAPRGKRIAGDLSGLALRVFVKDPTVSDEQNEANLCKMVERLRADVGNNINYANRTDE